ncbi:unnamed protein product [Cyclocybe aegerita]|uniref:Polyprotein n=1 Tax=Cyclocybe aegerita TaxID=1973307 RepID=A0A8S0WSZ2_CYCAE|nr:unnamed protein product [Cyclocybe aegerita]
MWLQVRTCPDLSFAINLLSRYEANPSPTHWKALQHVLTYIKGTIHYKITYDPNSPDSLNISGYSDSDYAGDPDTMRSTSGYVFTMAGGPVTWSSKRQPTTASSTTEAEYMALNRACQQAIYSDNKGSVDLAKNVKGITKAKHIHIKHHYICERVNECEVDVIQILTESNVADILTKPLLWATHKKFVHALQLNTATNT